MRVVLKGVLDWQAADKPSYGMLWRRVIFYAEPDEVPAATGSGAALEAEGTCHAWAHCGGAMQTRWHARVGCQNPRCCCSAAHLAGASAGGAATGGTAGDEAATQLRTAAKTLPDFDGVGGCWVCWEDVERIKLRSASEPLTWFPYVASGGAVAPLEMPAERQPVFGNFVF